MIKGIAIALAIAIGLIAFPALPVNVEESDWREFNSIAYDEYADEFTRLFEATEVKWSKNNRLMVKGASATSFKFAPKGK